MGRVPSTGSFAHFPRSTENVAASPTGEVEEAQEDKGDRPLGDEVSVQGDFKILARRVD